VVRDYTGRDRVAIEGLIEGKLSHQQEAQVFLPAALMTLGMCGDVKATRSNNVKLSCFREGVISWATIESLE
jgi:hypothetical protein